ncbi:hypothetical protein [Adhaeribacter terreus]
MPAVKAQQTDFNSLFTQADVVLSGHVMSIDGTLGTEDLGTEQYLVQLSIDSIYKHTFPIPDHKTTRIGWEISNLLCREKPMKKCISKYQDGKWIFFLKHASFMGPEVLPESCIRPFSEANAQRMVELQQQHAIPIVHFNRDKICDASCELCRHVKVCDWKKVEKYVAKHCNDRNSPKWMQHQRIKWILDDRAILLSLPSSMGVRYMFSTDSGEVEAYINFQVGYYKAYTPWIPHILSSWFNWDLYKNFTVEKTDTLILRSFKPHTQYSIEYLFYEKANYTRMLTDTSKVKFFGPNMPLADRDVLLAAVFDGELRLYEDYKTMPIYVEWSKQYIDKLLAEKKVYLLSLMASHTIPEIGMYSLHALRQLNDVRCIPFLIRLADYRKTLPRALYETYQGPIRNFSDSLLFTLDFFTGSKTYPQKISYGGSNDYFYTDQCIAIWRSRIREED